MGWLANYRWLKSLQDQTLSKIDHAKIAATKVEKNAAKKILNLPNVRGVYHALRLNNIDGGKSRREVDLIVLMSDRILLIEIKNFSGTITMDELGKLHQNGIGRNWNFERLDDAKRRLVDIMRETGIRLGKAEVHSVLALLGSGTADNSVSSGVSLTGTAVAKSINEIGEFMSQPLGDDGTLSAKHIQALKTFLDMCGTWDTMILANGVELEGDFLSNKLVDIWRQNYHKGRFSNRRGWFGSLIYGPEIIADVVDWNGEKSTIPIETSTQMQLRQPGSNSLTAAYTIDHLQGFEFGYKELPDWSNVVLMESSEHDSSISEPMDGQDSPYQKGEIVKDASVSFHHDAGIFFRLSSANKGMYFFTKMSNIELSNYEILYPVGKRIDVEVTAIKKRGKKWEIQVSPT